MLSRRRAAASMAVQFALPLHLACSGGARHLLTVLALATGVALVCAFDVADRSALAAFSEVLDIMGGRAALQVTAGGEGGRFPRQVAMHVGRVPGVQLAVPVIAGTMFLDGGGELLAVHGMDLVNARAVGIYEPTDEAGPAMNLRALRPKAVLLTRALAARRHLTIGDIVGVDTPRGRKELVIEDLLAPRGIGSTLGESLAVTSLETAERLFTAPGLVNRVDVVLATGAEREQVAAAITAVLPPGLHVEAPVQRKADLERAIRALQRLLQAVGAVALVEAFLVAFNSLTTVFRGRMWQLGVLQAIGIQPRVIRRMLVTESVILGLGGIAVGIPLGIGLGRLLLPWITTATALNVMRLAPPAAFKVRGAALVFAAALGIASAALAAVIPARRAVATAVAALIRSRGSEPPATGHSWRWVGGALVAISIVVATLAQGATRAAGWGLAVTALAPFAVLVAARPVSSLVVRLLAARMLVRPATRLAAITLGHMARRTALTVATLAIGLGAVVWLWVVAWSFERSVIDAHADAIDASLVISSPHIASGVNASPIDGTLIAALGRVDGLRALIGNRVVDWQYAGGPIAIDAYDPSYFSGPAHHRARLVGAHDPDVWPQLAAGEAVLVSPNFVYNLNRQVRDVITLDTPSGPLVLPVAGVLNHLWSPRGTVIVSRALYERYWNDATVNRIYADLADGADRAEVRAAVARVLGSRFDLQVFSHDALVGYFGTQVRRAFAGVDLLAALMLAVVLVAVGETLGAGVTERAWEIGILRSIGVHWAVLKRMVLVEAMLLGAIGVGLAIVTGVLLARFWVATTFAHLLGWVLDWYVPWRAIGVLAVLALSACAVAAWLPARRLARLEPVAALREER